MSEVLAPLTEPQVSLQLFRVLTHAIHEAYVGLGSVLTSDDLDAALEDEHPANEVSFEDLNTILQAEIYKGKIIGTPGHLIERAGTFYPTHPTDEVMEAMATAVAYAKEKGSNVVDVEHLKVAVLLLKERGKMLAELNRTLENPEMTVNRKAELVHEVNRATRQAIEFDRLYH
ncbi:hypothetical protein HYZ78_04060 [Candidatus Microgenomates bacterium]|nr:hypothetical protein [Candidatus Microgenomates bacterium]